MTLDLSVLKALEQAANRPDRSIANVVEFANAAYSAFPALIARVEELEAENTRLTEELAELGEAVIRNVNRIKQELQQYADNIYGRPG